MNVIWHLNQFQYVHIILGGNSTESSKEDQVVTYRIKQNAPVFEALVAMVKDTIVAFSCFHQIKNLKILY